MADPTKVERLSAEREASIRATVEALSDPAPHWTTHISMVADLLAEIDALRAERDPARRATADSRDLFEKAMRAIHREAGIKRDGLAAILAWIADARRERDEAIEADRAPVSASHEERARSALGVLNLLSDSSYAVRDVASALAAVEAETREECAKLLDAAQEIEEAAAERPVSYGDSTHHHSHAANKLLALAARIRAEKETA